MMTPKLEKMIDGCYTGLLCVSLNVSWKQHITNTMKERQLKLVGHCVQLPEEVALCLVLWESAHGWARRGRKKTPYVDVLRKDVDLRKASQMECLL